MPLHLPIKFKKLFSRLSSRERPHHRLFWWLSLLRVAIRQGGRSVKVYSVRVVRVPSGTEP
jgi:hypothetical protein